MNLKSKLSKLVSGFTAAVMCITMLPGIPKLSSSAASVGDSRRVIVTATATKSGLTEQAAAVQ